MSRSPGVWRTDSASWETWTSEHVSELVPGDRYYARTGEGIGLSLLVCEDGGLTVETRSGLAAERLVGLRVARRVRRGPVQQ